MALAIVITACEPHAVGNGRRLLDGDVTEPFVTGSMPDGAIVLAHDESTGELIMVPFEGGAACRAAPATWDTAEAPRLDADGAWLSDEPLRVVTYTGPTAGPGTVRFLDAGCGVTGPTVDDVSLAMGVLPLFTDAQVVAYGALTVSGQVVHLDPWRGTSTAIATGVTGWTSFADGLLAVEAGELVMRSSAGDERARVGAGVSAMDAGVDRVAFVDASGLHVAAASLATAEDIDPVGCSPTWLSASPPLLLYETPCGSGELTVRDVEAGELMTVGSAESVRWLGGRMFSRASDGALTSAAWGGTPEPVGVVESLRDVTTGAPGTFLALLADGEGRRLATWAPGAPAQTVVAGAVTMTSFRGYIAATVPDASGHHLLVFLAQADLVPRVIAEQVAPDQVRFAFTAPAIGYLRDYDPVLRAGTLAVWVPSANREMVVASDVREFREVRWPEVGVLYTIAGDGLWFLSLEEALRDG